MPSAWVIQPAKLACLLRCADAVQIDQRRAPRFSYALHNPTASSRQHWDAQQLGQPVVKVGDLPTELIFTSQFDFTAAKADAWWIAFDLIRVADRELRTCYQFMKRKGFDTLQVDRIAGASSPTDLQHHVRTVGWRPVNAEVRVTDVASIIRLFGGTQLYGADASVPLREAIQNASDAVRARLAMSKEELYSRTDTCST